VAGSGAVDETELRALAGRWFGAEAPTQADEPGAADFIGGASTLSRKIEQANLVFQLPAPPVTAPTFAATRLMTEILGGGMASRLFQSAREDRGLAYAVDAYHEAYETTGVLGIYAGAAADRSVELAQVCAAELKARATAAPRVGGLWRSRAVRTAGRWTSDERPASRSGRAASQTLVFGAPIPSEDSATRLAAQSVEDVRRAAEACLTPGRAATAVLGPKAAHAAGDAFTAALFAG